MEQLLTLELYKYGFLPLLVVLERMAQKDEFEICSNIVNVIKTQNEKFDLDLPTKFDGTSVAIMKIAFMINHNLSGEISYANKDIYADEIIKSINNFKIKENGIQDK